MLELHLAQRQLDQLGYSEPNRTLERVERARRLFHQSYRKGKWGVIQGRLTGRSTQMLDLALVAAKEVISGRYDIRLQTVSLDQIQGSEGRVRDFDRHFNPLKSHNEERWINLAIAMMAEVGLPPVKLVKVGDYYYVQDGHHRVSVARALGQLQIDAEVTVWEVKPPAETKCRTLTERSCQGVPCFSGCGCTI